MPFTSYLIASRRRLSRARRCGNILLQAAVSATFLSLEYVSFELNLARPTLSAPCDFDELYLHFESTAANVLDYFRPVRRLSVSTRYGET